MRGLQIIVVVLIVAVMVLGYELYNQMESMRRVVNVQSYTSSMLEIHSDMLLNIDTAIGLQDEINTEVVEMLKQLYEAHAVY